MICNICEQEKDRSNFYRCQNVGYAATVMGRCKKCHNSLRRTKKKKGLAVLNDEQRAIFDAGVEDGKKKTAIFRELQGLGFTRAYTTMCSWM